MRAIKPEFERNDIVSDAFLHINSSGIARLSDVRPKTDCFKIYRPNGRRDYQIMIVISGELDIMAGGTVITLTENDVCLFPPGITNKYMFKIDKNGCYTAALYIHFTGSATKEIMDDLEISDIAVRRSVDIRLRKMFESVIMLCKYRNNYAAIGLLLQIISVFKDANHENVSPTVLKIRDTAGYINLHFVENLDIEKLAARCEMSKSTFAHLFKTEYGVSPYSYVLRLRLEKAAELLASSSLNINEVAYQTGFSDPYYFTRYFGQKYGLSPTEYRAAARAKPEARNTQS